MLKILSCNIKKARRYLFCKREEDQEMEREKGRKRMMRKDCDTLSHVPTAYDECNHYVLKTCNNEN